MVFQQRHQQVAEHHGVGHRIGVFQLPGRMGPCIVDFVGRAMLVAVPDVLFVEGELDGLLALDLDVIGGGHDDYDEVLHVQRGGEVGAQIAVTFRVVGVAGDVVHVVVAVFSITRSHSPKVGMEELEDPQTTSSRFLSAVFIAEAACGERSVVFGGHVADLPRAVHLVSQAPHADVVGIPGAVGDPLLAQGGA